MKVNSNQANPASRHTEITDGTSNTLQVGEQAKAEKPFAKDSFEIGSPKGALDAQSKDAAKIRMANGIESPRDAQTGMVRRGETTTPMVQNEIDMETKKLELHDEKVIENLNVKYTLFLPDE